MPLVDAVIVGGMKCGTTALHGYLAGHPDVAASEPKELNFFFGARPGGPGNWWRGAAWYDGCFPARGGFRVDASPGYTSPDHPRVAERMRRLVPDVRVLYLARSPLERAVSQFRHHRRDGDEQRSLAAALLDPDSQYVARSRHFERLRPYLDLLGERQVAVVEHHALLHDRRRVLRAVFSWLGLDPGHWDPSYAQEHNAARSDPPAVPARLRAQFEAAVADDAERFRHVAARLSITAGSRACRR